MSRLPWGRISVVLFVLIICGLILAFKPIILGLDLQGGAHLLIRVHADEAVEKEVYDAFASLQSALREAENSRGEKSIEMVDAETEISITFKSQDDRTAFPEGMAYYKLIDNPDTDPPYISIKLSNPSDVPAADAAIRRHVSMGADGYWDMAVTGDTLRLTMHTDAIYSIRRNTVEKVRNRIESRINTLGVVEPTIVIQGDPNRSQRIVLQLPGIEDPEEAKRRIQTPGNLEWRMVVYDDNDIPYQGRTREEILDRLEDGRIPAGTELVPEYGQTSAEAKNQVREPDQWYLLYREARVDSKYLLDAETRRGQEGNVVVSFLFNAEGGDRFRQLTKANIDKLLAIVLDNEAIEAATIESEIGTEGQITGRFTQETADRLSFLLRTGAVPTSMHFEEERTVGPSLGIDSIRLGTQAMIWGLLLVILFMILYYRLSGLVAVTALALNLVLIMAFLAWFGARLTLPGVAGIVLMIGMAVDANVLIFERIREELRVGKTVLSSIEAGFGKAFGTIFDANVTTLIAAVFLFQFGTGPIRGFATTITIGILASMFTAVFVARVIFDSVLIVKRNKIKKLSI